MLQDLDEQKLDELTLGSTHRPHRSHCTARARCRFTEGSRRRLFHGAPDQHHTSRDPQRHRQRSGTRLTEPSADPKQPRTTIALSVSARQDVHQLIRLRTLLGALRSCR